MGAYRWAIACIAAKVEGTEGTDAAPDATNANIVAENVSLSPDLPFFERPAVSPSYSQFEGSSGGPCIGTLTCDVKLAGSGVAGTPPGWADLLECCMWHETDAAGSDTYTPGSAEATYTVRTYVDGKCYPMFGCRGDVSFDFNAGEPAVMHFKIMGVFQTPTTTAILAPTYSGATPVANCGGAFTLDSQPFRYKSFSVACNNKLTPRTVVSATYPNGAISIAMTGRNMTGTMDPEAEVEATYAFWTKWRANTAVALSLVIGATAGNICTITAPKVQYKSPGIGNRDGLLTTPLDLYFARNAGDDEFSIVLT